MKLSKRTEWDTEESDLARAHRERLAAGLPVYDLTASNPTRCGFEYPADLLSPLADVAAFDYDPDPRGSLRAREAVCRYYLQRGASIEPDQVILTTSTSEAYSYLFKLLCDPDDTVLVPQPSYPLFDFLAVAEAIMLAPVPLVYDHGWQLDLEGLRRQIRSSTSVTRAVVLVHPNNPTGHFTKLDEARELASICREHGLALIVDEVFLDYGLEIAGQSEAEDTATFAARDLEIPVFIVSGISKICGLPQMKAAWLVAVGPGSRAALKRLEVLADTYLSMNAPVQSALPLWLDSRGGIQEQIRLRVRRNLAALDQILGEQGSKTNAGKAEGGVLVNHLQIEGGWYAVLRIPAIQRDEQTVRELLDLGVWVHPGYFFGMGESGWLVVSLLGAAAEFSVGISLMINYLQRNQVGYR
ncbi:pyridoxal phosphate-dependent aminotransferase [Acidicapsa acidisoli]|uniref:pyridoxal phosphate-dependent aminotransferase n=1 Tax=Acidicapsa acidisoli TaxID=1615681 RepID=UPI0021E01657|nr:pyridoxal phosphate-dependent aminotransferase [Acidicapsa acidisoli]